MKDIDDTVGDMYFTVQLMRGEVEAQLSSEEITGPYKRCRNLREADLYSLNILRQNLAENTYKNDGVVPETMSRIFLGVHQIIDSSKIIPTMRWLEKTFPEKLI